MLLENGAFDFARINLVLNEKKRKIKNHSVTLHAQIS